MARILTGVQSTGVPHLGNILGAMLPAIAMSKEGNNDSFLFIADMHSLTTIRDGDVIRNNTNVVAAAWLALGLDVNKTVFYRQSRVPEVTELTWYLNCFMQYSHLLKAHSFKDKKERVTEVNAGLFTYPVLMAADILLYDAKHVPVGKDQKQHLEFTRDLAERINHLYGDGPDSILVVPEVKFEESTMYIPGTDGLDSKMSKSKGNTIDVLSTTPKALKKAINKQIITDSTPLEEPKDPNHLITKFMDLVAPADEAEALRKNLAAGGFGWGHAKLALIDALLARFADAREKFAFYMENTDELEKQLQVGEAKAREVAHETLGRVRKVLGY